MCGRILEWSLCGWSQNCTGRGEDYGLVSVWDLYEGKLGDGFEFMRKVWLGLSYGGNALWGRDEWANRLAVARFGVIGLLLLVLVCWRRGVRQVWWEKKKREKRFCHINVGPTGFEIFTVVPLQALFETQK